MFRQLVPPKVITKLKPSTAFRSAWRPHKINKISVCFIHLPYEARRRKRNSNKNRSDWTIRCMLGGKENCVWVTRGVFGPNQASSLFSSALWCFFFIFKCSSLDIIEKLKTRKHYAQHEPDSFLFFQSFFFSPLVGYKMVETTFIKLFSGGNIDNKKNSFYISFRSRKCIQILFFILMPGKELLVVSMMEIMEKKTLKKDFFMLRWFLTINFDSLVS